MIFAVLSIAALLTGDRVGGGVGRTALHILGLFLFAVGLFTAPWESLL